MKRALPVLLALALTLMPSVLHAVQPDEIMADPAQEARARNLSRELRCMVCQNQSIDDSDADLAGDLRRLVRERLLAGDSDDQVIAYLVSRYGEFVLLKPRFSARNALLWATPAVALAIGGAFIVVAARRRRTAASPLTAEERAELDKIVGGDAA